MFRRMAQPVILACCALTLSGCLVLSVEPFCADGSDIFEPALVGTWINAKEDLHWTFVRAGAKSNLYLLTELSDPENADSKATGGSVKKLASTFEARLFRSGSTLLIDLFPKNCKDCLAGAFWMMHTPPMHTLWRVKGGPEGLTVATLDEKQVRTLLTAGKIPVSSGYRDSGHDVAQLLLTSQTAELQAFVKAMLASKDAWGDDTVLTRQ
jgi:hypothetical protein